MSYLVTGATGFIGRHLLAELLRNEESVRVLVRPASAAKLPGLAGRLGIAPERLIPVVGDVTAADCGISDATLPELSGVDIFHLAAVYDLDADEATNQQVNVEGTRNVVALANRVGGRLHHVSSIAVAGGSFKGDFTEEMFDQGQSLGHPYYRTKFDSEKVVREECAVPFRIYRPGIVIGSSETGVADRVDGPYYAFKLIQRLRGALPQWWPLVGPEGGPLNLVPVDFVARALSAIARQQGHDGRTFHIVDPEPLSLGDTLNEFCRAAHAPEFTLRLDRRAFNILPGNMRKMVGDWPVMQTVRRRVLDRIHIPEAALAYMDNRARFTVANTAAALEGTGVECPHLHTYAWRIWDHWERHLDPELPTEANLRRALAGRVVVVTGASSGIGNAVARTLARHGAQLVLVSRSREKLDELAREIEVAGGSAFVRPTDLSDLEAIDGLVAELHQRFGRVDILVNNAGRSIRRATLRSIDRFHDFQRTMQLNYFGAIRLMLGVIPGMQERGGGQVINISSIGVQSYPPRFAAYVASKSALSAFSRCLGPEVADDGVTITNIHMPLVRTPMIAPTTIYRAFPTIDTDEAADMVINAILTRPQEVSTRLGKLGQTVDNVAPGLLHLIMTGAYHVFPEGGRMDVEAAGNGKAPKDAADGEEVSTEAMALAYLMRGIHL
ncbi:MAG: SDR family oxidoreductase [Candidatus Dormibacteria bacterium]